MIHNVVILSEEFPKETQFGGISTYNKDLSMLLAGQGFRVYVICRTFGKSRIEHAGCKVIIIRVRALFSIVRPLEKLLGWKLSCYVALKSLMKKRKISIVETPEWNADLLFGFLLGAIPPTIVRLHGCRGIIRKYEAKRLSMSDRLFVSFEKYIVGKAKYISSISKSCLEETEKVYHLNLRNKAIVIPNFTESISCVQTISPLDKRIILFAGRVELWKGVFSLCKAINVVCSLIDEDIEFVFAGRDIYDKSEDRYSSDICKQILGSNIDKCVFLGQIAKVALDKLYLQAYVTVLPSRFEPFGLCCIEAMKHGCPVIGSRSGGMREIISDGIDGFLVVPEDIEGIAMKIVELLKDENLRNIMSVNAKEKIESNFSFASIGEKYKWYYNKIISENE